MTRVVEVPTHFDVPTRVGIADRLHDTGDDEQRQNDERGSDRDPAIGPGIDAMPAGDGGVKRRVFGVHVVYGARLEVLAVLALDTSRAA